MDEETRKALDDAMIEAEIKHDKRISERENAIRLMLLSLGDAGENPARDGLKDTPNRVARMWDELFSGYYDAEGRIERLMEKTFDSDNENMVIVRDIDFFSTCEHHIMPFFGKVTIGYIPNGKVLGISKLARLVEIFARRLQIQEQMTTQIADAIDKYLAPQGVMVIVEAMHTCMSARGAKAINAKTVTSEVRGVFKSNPETRKEFMDIIK